MAYNFYGLKLIFLVWCLIFAIAEQQFIFFCFIFSFGLVGFIICVFLRRNCKWPIDCFNKLKDKHTLIIIISSTFCVGILRQKKKKRRKTTNTAAARITHNLNQLTYRVSYTTNSLHPRDSQYI